MRSRSSDRNAAAPVDPMMRWVAATPDDVESLWRLGSQAPGWVLDEWPDGIAILGMGGSGIAGMLLESILEPLAAAPVTWCVGHELPAWVGPRSLVLACSYSGETSEVLGLVDDVKRSGAGWCAVTSGGSLEARAGEAGVPVLSLEPGRAPRSMSAGAFAGLLARFRGLVPSLDDALRRAVAGLRADVAAWRLEDAAFRAADAAAGSEPWPLAAREPRALARCIKGRTPILYGWGRLGEAVAYRWQCQLAENGKAASHAHRLPEVLHNEIVAWGGWAGLTPPPVVLHLVSEDDAVWSGGDDGAVRWNRMWIELQRAGLEALRVPAAGGGPLERALRQILLGDAVSVLLATAKGIEATPVQPIERLKAPA